MKELYSSVTKSVVSAKMEIFTMTVSMFKFSFEMTDWML